MSNSAATLMVQQALELAVQHHEAGRLADAETIYQQILLENPDHPDALHLLGVIAHQLGKSEQAATLISNRDTERDVSLAEEDRTSASRAPQEEGRDARSPVEGRAAGRAAGGG